MTTYKTPDANLTDTRKTPGIRDFNNDKGKVLNLNAIISYTAAQSRSETDVSASQSSSVMSPARHYVTVSVTPRGTRHLAAHDIVSGRTIYDI